MYQRAARGNGSRHWGKRDLAVTSDGVPACSCLFLPLVLLSCLRLSCFGCLGAQCSFPGSCSSTLPILHQARRTLALSPGLSSLCRSGWLTSTGSFGLAGTAAWPHPECSSTMSSQSVQYGVSTVFNAELLDDLTWTLGTCYSIHRVFLRHFDFGTWVPGDLATSRLWLTPAAD